MVLRSPLNGPVTAKKAKRRYGSITGAWSSQIRAKRGLRLLRLLGKKAKPSGDNSKIALCRARSRSPEITDSDTCTAGGEFYRRPPDIRAGVLA